MRTPNSVVRLHLFSTIGRPGENEWKVDFSVVRIAPGVPNVTRVYERFTDVVDDTIDPACTRASTSAQPMNRVPGSARMSPTGSASTISSP